MEILNELGIIFYIIEQLSRDIFGYIMINIGLISIVCIVRYIRYSLIILKFI